MKNMLCCLPFAITLSLHLPFVCIGWLLYAFRGVTFPVNTLGFSVSALKSFSLIKLALAPVSILNVTIVPLTNSGAVHLSSVTVLTVWPVSFILEVCVLTSSSCDTILMKNVALRSSLSSVSSCTVCTPCPFFLERHILA